MLDHVGHLLLAIIHGWAAVTGWRHADEHEFRCRAGVALCYALMALFGR